jgi:hypothetical protein
MVVDITALPARIDAPANVIHRVELAEDGFLAVRRTGHVVAVAPYLCILTDLDSRSCLDTGANEVGVMLPAGSAYVVADPEDPAGADASVTLEINVVTADSLEASGLAAAPAADALQVFGAAWQRRDTRRFEYAVIDFTLHSREPREWIFDLATGQLLHQLHVAHGRGSTEGENTGVAVTFSNVPESHQSSLGLLRTAEPYVGDWGPSHRFDGLEPGINDLVRDRDIVMHPWEGSRPEYVAEHGEAAPTWGCPAIDDRIAPDVRGRMANGALMLFWHDSPAWRDASTYLQ